jgi:hypothetical protein
MPAPTFTLPLCSAVTSIAFTIVKPIKKEYTTGARIKAIYMLNEKQPWAKILAITGISKSCVYALAAVARERGWEQDTDIIIKVKHVLNAPRSGRPQISVEAIKCVLKLMLQNSTTRGFSYGTLAKEACKRGHEIALRTIWKILRQASYS